MDSENNLKQHWQIVNAGGQVLSTTPQMMWEAAAAYFKWCDDNPITSSRTLTSGKDSGKKVTFEHIRPYSVKAFCLHANLSLRHLKDIEESQDKNSEWYMVIEKILMIIYTQNLEGAMVDIYNPIMTSKILNLDGDKDSEGSHVKVEIVDSRSTGLANSENELLKKLDQEKLIKLESKAEISKGNSSHESEHGGDSVLTGT